MFIPKQSLAGSNNGLFKGIVQRIDLPLIFQETSLNSKSSFVFQSNDNAESVARKCFAKIVLLRFLQNLQESNCARVSFLTKLQVSDDASDTRKSACGINIKHLRSRLINVKQSNFGDNFHA